MLRMRVLVDMVGEGGVGPESGARSKTNKSFTIFKQLLTLRPFQNMSSFPLYKSIFELRINEPKIY